MSETLGTNEHSPLKRRTFLAATGSAALVAGSGTVARATTGGHPARVATVVVNGRVFTGTRREPLAEAVAIGTDGTVVAVGSTAEIRRQIGPRTVVLDAHGGTVMPGIQDGHMHPLGAATESLKPSLGNATLTVAELRARLKEMLDATAAKEPDGWLQVTNWNPAGLLPAGTVADRKLLDSLDTRRPIVLQGSDLHNTLVNSRALTLAGINRTTPAPAGGSIVRDAAREPTGLLKDNAQVLVTKVLPQPTSAQLDAVYTKMASTLLACGITSFMDAACGEDTLKTYTALMAKGLLPQRITPALLVDQDTAKKPAEAAEYLRDLRSRYAGPDRLRLTTAKVFLDGVPEFPAQGAALLAPYLDAEGRPTTHRGDLYVSDRDYRALVLALDKAGWQMHAHAIGDRAVRVALNAYEAAAHTSRHHRRHTITHLEFVHPDDYKRFARAGVVANMQMQWAKQNVFTSKALRPYIGEERFARLYPARSLLRAGARLAGGSDWPVDPLRPFDQLATAIDRSNPDEDLPPLNAGEALTRAQTLSMHTAGTAYQLHDAQSGTLRAGQRADLIVLDRDITKVPMKEVRGSSVCFTMIAGQVVHDATSAAGRERIAAAQQMGALGGDKTPGASCCHGH
ncbi:amidohydrolase [Streptomyces inhibens]|uniref:amidohydrolase n=1 Tax=Streptomyces inhibens TaxID=2293571 RepID=UPI001EE6D774|nr:amidohydrolase [Streptomyces inhibens]UKY54754.1 amidohydrolase [Streptomyces inhibens]